MFVSTVLLASNSHAMQQEKSRGFIKATAQKLLAAGKGFLCGFGATLPFVDYAAMEYSSKTTKQQDQGSLTAGFLLGRVFGTEEYFPALENLITKPKLFYTRNYYFRVVNRYLSIPLILYSRYKVHTGK
jgi:hypothetical protein